MDIRFWSAISLSYNFALLICLCSFTNLIIIIIIIHYRMFDVIIISFCFGLRLLPEFIKTTEIGSVSAVG
jgi:hypothetical protein